MRSLCGSLRKNPMNGHGSYGLTPRDDEGVIGHNNRLSKTLQLQGAVQNVFKNILKHLLITLQDITGMIQQKFVYQFVPDGFSAVQLSEKTNSRRPWSCGTRVGWLLGRRPACSAQRRCKARRKEWTAAHLLSHQSTRWFFCWCLITDSTP